MLNPKPKQTFADFARQAIEKGRTHRGPAPSSPIPEEVCPPAWQPPLETKATRRFPMRSAGSLRAELVGPDNRQIIVESARECAVCYTLFARQGVVDVWEQPPSVTYVLDGVSHTHIFDFRITYSDGIRTAVDVKIRRKKAAMQRLHKVLAPQLPAGYADKLIVLCREDFSRATLRNAELFHFLRKDVDPEADEAVRAFVSTLRGASALASIAEATGLGARAFRAAGRLVADRTLELVGDVELWPSAMVRRPLRQTP